MTVSNKIARWGASDTVEPMIQNVSLRAAAQVYGGDPAWVDASGYGVAEASVTSACRCIGIWKTDVLGGASDGDVRADAEQGTFLFTSATAGDAVTIAHIGLTVYRSARVTVANGSNGGTRPVLGKVAAPGVDPQTSKIPVTLGMPAAYGTLDYTAPRYYARGVKTTNVASLAAFTVASVDGITYVAGDIVLLVGQSTAAQNGPYIVGTVGTGTAPLTRPSWFSATSAIQQGLVIEVGGEGTTYGGSTWKALCAKSKVVDTDDPLFYPQVIKGSAAATSGTLTVTGLCITSNAIAMAEDFTTPANNAALAATLTAGASGAGQIAITGGTTTDVMKYIIQNW